MGSTKPPSLSVGSVYSRIKKVQAAQKRDIQIKSAQSLVRIEDEHCVADDLSQPDLAKFELPKKMSRPWIVNNAFEQEKLKDLIVTERPVEASLVMRQIKESKQERKKQPGYNKKHIRNPRS